MRSVTLPNGQVVENVPDDVTDADVLKQASVKGIFVEQNYKTGADWFPVVGEIAGGVGGSILGAAAAGAVIGSAVPGVGTLVGGLLGGAIGTFAGSYLGQKAEASSEDRIMDTRSAISQASKAAAIDVVAGGALGAFGLGIKAISKPLIDLVNPAIRPLDELDAAINLQAKLGVDKYNNTSLLPSQIGDTRGVSRVSEAYASSSIGFETRFGDMMAGYEQYAAETAENILKQLPSGSRLNVGDAFLTLADEAETAFSASVSPLYKQLDIDGGISLSTRQLKEAVSPILSAASKRALAGSGGISSYVPSKGVKRVQDFVNSLKGDYTPASLTKDVLPTLQNLKRTVSGDPLALGVVRKLENEIKLAQNHPALVRTSTVRAGAAKIGGRRINKLGETGRSGPEREAYNYVTKLRDKMSFSEAREELSYIKGRLRDIQKSANSDSAAERIWSSAVVNMEESMEKSSKVLGGELYDRHRTLADAYKSATQIISAPFMEKALKNNEVAQVAEMLVKTGTVTPMKQVDDLLKLASDYGVKGGQNVRDQLTRKYLDALLSDPQIYKLDALSTRLKDERFLDTFNAVVNDPVMRTQIKELFSEASLIARHGYGASAGQSLAIRSREIGSITAPGRMQSIAFALAPNIVSKRLSNAEISKRLVAMKEVRRALDRGLQPPGRAIKLLTQTVPKASIPTGFALGALTQE